ncbi:MAG TPA: CaiB/BaiF CoA-transferase family protein [Terriglobales bacterium]|nr:CaiB/BaiF CoA-transferase family protein [Terriglobales bacterium]
MPTSPAPLAGVRVLDCSMLGPGATAMHLADLGAEVIKIEAPGGDYIRKMAFPIIDGISLLHWHINRGKQSLVLNLRSDAGVEVFFDLVRKADVVIEAMRPGALDRRGITFARMREHNPRIVYCHVSGYGLSGPYRDLPSHGYAYDAWAGVARPVRDETGHPAIPAYTTVGIHAGPLFAALGVVAAVLRARTTGVGCELEVAQSEAAAAFNWNGIEGNKSHERPEDEVTGNSGDGKPGPRQPMGDATMKEAVRYQFYDSADGVVLFMASERELWRNFCEAVERMDLFERFPGARVAEHARGNLELRAELAAIFRQRTTKQWIELGLRANVPLGPVHDTRTVASDPQFLARLSWLPHQQHGTDLLPTPIRFLDQPLPEPSKAPVEPGQDSEAVLRQVLELDDAAIAALKTRGALG